jgi:hypothetical protein
MGDVCELNAPSRLSFQSAGGQPAGELTLKKKIEDQGRGHDPGQGSKSIEVDPCERSGPHLLGGHENHRQEELVPGR